MVKVVNVLEVVGEDETRRLDNQVLGARKAPPPARRSRIADSRLRTTGVS